MGISFVDWMILGIFLFGCFSIVHGFVSLIVHLIKRIRSRKGQDRDV